MTPIPDLTRPHTVILMSPVLVQDYARLLDQALGLIAIAHPTPPQPIALAIESIEKVAHHLANDILTSAKLTIDPDRQIHIHIPKELVSP